MKNFSYEGEKGYYSSKWPTELQPYRHLESYFTSWMDPVKAFKGKKVLDIGAGECVYSRLIAERFAPAELVAMDLFKERMLPVIESNKNPIIKFIQGDCFNMPFDDKTFDVVFGGLVLTQLPNLHKVILEIKRVLKHGGIYIGFEPNPYNLVIAYRYFFKRHSPNQYLFYPKIFCPEFEKAGFNLKFHYFYGKLPVIKNKFLGTCIGIQANL